MDTPVVPALLRELIKKVDRLGLAVEKLGHILTPHGHSLMPPTGPRKQRRKGTPWKHRPHHRAFYRLSSHAQARALQGFKAHETTVAIVTALREQFGEVIPCASLNRFREWWEIELRFESFDEPAA